MNNWEERKFFKAETTAEVGVYSMMTEEEVRMSMLRWHDYDGLSSEMKEKLRKGEFDLKLSDPWTKVNLEIGRPGRSGEFVSISGKIGKHQIFITIRDGDGFFAGSTKGSIDEKSFKSIPGGEKLMDEIIQKYLPIVKLQNDKVYEYRVYRELKAEAEKRREEKHKKTNEYKEKEQFALQEKVKREKDKQELEKQARIRFKDIV